MSSASTTSIKMSSLQPREERYTNGKNHDTHDELDKNQPDSSVIQSAANGTQGSPRVDIEFVNLTFTVPVSKDGSWKVESKELLQSVSGLFKSNQLTAILGSSGAGKSTLLNVLAGYNTGQWKGTILINGEPRNLNKFRKLSRYIMQEDLLHPMFTVFENMSIAADLKLGTTVSLEEKHRKIEEILSMLRLTKTKNTRTGRLSGGERKRLSIALELVDDPVVLFLDEPTTGLDDLSSIQCISLLRMIAKQGRTVICTIHTPSAKIFSHFDHVYVMAEGQCMYAGLGNDIVPFLATLGLNCPINYNPADFVIEVVNREYGDHNESMVKAIENGRLYRWNDVVSCHKSANYNKDNLKPSTEFLNDNLSKHEYDFKCSGWLQFNILLRRMLLQTWRDKNFLLIKLTTYLFIGVFVGAMYFQKGNDASKSLNNFGFCVITAIIFLYVPMFPVLLRFPREIKFLRREHLNRWYGLNAYFFALVFSTTVLQIILALFYAPVSYIISGQPFEWNRGARFSIICIYMAIVSESMGFVIAAMLNVVNSLFIGPTMTVPLMVLSVYGAGAGTAHIPILIKIGMYSSPVRYALEGLMMSIYDNGRKKMACPLIICDLAYPNDLLKLVGMQEVNYWTDLIALIGFYIVFRLASYVLLRMRLSTTPSRLASSFIGRFAKTHFK
ncbi:ATP-binding cassette subfamily G member 4-like isoform X2 [Planococcus citri]